MLVLSKENQQEGQILQPGKILYPDSPIRFFQRLQLPKYNFKPKFEFCKGVLHISSYLSMAESLGQSSLSGYECNDNDSYESPDSLDSPTVQEAHLPFSRSLLDTILTAEWELRLADGIFRYDVTSCPNKTIPGFYRYVAQLNEGRANKKRATEFKVDQVVQPFDDNKFNFNKAMQKEVMFMFEPNHNQTNSYYEDLGQSSLSPNLLIINISPIDYGHVLLVPRIYDNLPQLVTYDSMCLAINFALEINNEFFRIGFNSLGAYGTINNLHFQAYYNYNQFPVETAQYEAIAQQNANIPKDVIVSKLVDYPVKGFVVESKNNFSGIARVVSDVCSAMAKINQPHNLLMVDSGKKVFIWPQCYAERQAQKLVPQDILECGVNPACFEIAGHLVMKRAQDYEDLNESYIIRLLQQTSVQESKFRQLESLCFGDMAQKNY